MAPVWDAFLKLLGTALGNESAAPMPELTAQQWSELCSLAGAHKVLPLVFEPAYPLISRADPALAAAMKQQVRRLVIGQTLRSAEFLELYRALEEAGAPPLVVKGIVCRQLYPHPDHRPSADEDLLIPPEQFELCHRAMEAQGLRACGPLDSYEIPYRKPGSALYIELHKALFPPESAAYGDLNGFFPDPFGSAAVQPVSGGSVHTLEPGSHLTYLLFHAFKHFLHSGFGIRQVCDILLFARANAGCIDFDAVAKSCRAIRAEKFAGAVFAIGTRHLGFEPMGTWPETAELPLLEDVLRAGIYGSAERSRQHSSTITLQAVAARKQETSDRRGVLAAAFPASKDLEDRYPWVKKQPYLVPIAWADRMTGYLRETLRRPDSSLADTLKLGAERKKLLRQYDILD